MFSIKFSTRMQRTSLPIQRLSLGLKAKDFINLKRLKERVLVGTAHAPYV